MKLFLMLEPSTKSSRHWLKTALGDLKCVSVPVLIQTQQSHSDSHRSIAWYTHTPSSPKQHRQGGNGWGLFRDTHGTAESKCLLCRVLQNPFASLPTAQKLHSSPSLCCFLLNFHITSLFSSVGLVKF